MSQQIEDAGHNSEQSKSSRLSPFDASMDQILSALEYLSTLQPAADLPQPQEPPKEFPACSPPDARTPPQFEVAYRRPFLIGSLPDLSGEFTGPQLACVTVESNRALQSYLAFDLRFEQTWNLLKLGIGDLASTMTLAPSEKLTLEFQSTQRRQLEQTTLDSAEELTSNESTTLDKEVANVVRASSKTDNWHIDAHGSVSVSYAGIGASVGVNAGTSSTTTHTSQITLEHITESTQKSAQNLKTLHKIEVHGVSEELIQNRMTRIIKNPYHDRTLALNIFQLIKHFSVQSKLAEVRVALVFRINSLTFDPDFVISNADFLRSTLLDQSLLDELPIALQGAQQSAQSFPLSGQQLETAKATAKLALQFLYDIPNIFHVPHLLDPIHPGSTLPEDPNSPANAFDGSLYAFPTQQEVSAKAFLNGFLNAIENGWGIIFTTLNFFYKVYQELVTTNQLNEHAIAIAVAISDGVKTLWEEETKATDPTKDPSQEPLAKILSPGGFNEIFRRLSGFLAMVSGMLEPLLPAADKEKQDAQEQAKAVFVLSRLITHLQCNEHYYTQQFLAYIAEKTNNVAIIDFVNQVIDLEPVLPQVRSLLRLLFDADRTFIDRQQIIVPHFLPLKEEQITELGKRLSSISDPPAFHFEDIHPTVVNIEVPCDGIHLEVAEGTCVLSNVPQEDEDTLELVIHDASLKVNVPD